MACGGAVGRTNCGALLRRSFSLAVWAFISKLSSEGAVLQGGEEGVQLGEGGAVRGFQFVDGGDAAGEILLEGERRCNEGHSFKHCLVYFEGTIGRPGQRFDLATHRGGTPYVLQECPHDPIW